MSPPGEGETDKGARVPSDRFLNWAELALQDITC
jgi:hypothetical protein